MEALSTPRGGGEARRIHIIYFLNRMGHVEHPHLIRIHYLNRKGVYLRDVKRWLADLRGKDMPEAFTWSYKRRYKNSYVWQDLLDGDLITPISDNEYVLKGSEIFSTASNDVSPHDYILFKDKEPKPVDQDSKRRPSPPGAESNTSIEQGSPVSGSEKSTLTEDSIRQIREEHPNPSKHRDQQHVLASTEELENLPPPNLLGEKDGKGSSEKQGNKRIGGLSFSRSTSLPSDSTPAKSNKSHTSRPSKLLCNLITCGAAGVDDVILVVPNNNDNNHSNDTKSSPTSLPATNQMDGTVSWSPSNQQQQSHSLKPWTISKSFGGIKDSTKKQQLHNRIACSTDISAAYKPQGTPACSQCGKPFKPEKLQAHMKSCKRVKAFAKNVATSSEEITPYNCRESSQTGSAACGYFLTDY